jgi:hypothetical protein
MRAAASEALKRAALICGGARVLCARLGVDEAMLEAWLERGERIPHETLLKVVEILVADYDAWRAQDRRSEPREKRRVRAGVA